jgi:hypothetical protein
LILAFMATSSIAWSQAPFVSSCAEDAEIEAAKRQAVDNSAIRFLQTLFSPDPSAAFDGLSTERRQITNRDEVSALARNVIQQFFTDEHDARIGDLKDARIQKTYLISLKGKSPGSLVCASNLSKPDGWVSVAASDAPEQAHVLISVPARNNEITFTFWLVPEQNLWKVQSFWTSVSTLADKDALQIWQLARAQVAQGHAFNAALLLNAASGLAQRGPDFQEGITQSISKDISALALPAELKGQPPLLWKSANNTWKVLSVSPTAVAGKIYVIIVHEVHPWQTDAQVDGWNKELLTWFKRRFPEYSGVFAGLVARARESGTNRGYGTVEAPGTPK